jgi:hypothetical protein
MSEAVTIDREQAQAGGLARPAPGQGKPRSGAVEARDALWLYELNQGSSIAQIARRSHLSCRQVQLGVARARKREQERMQSLQIRDSRERESVHGRKEIFSTGAHRGVPAWDDPRRLPRLVPLFPIGPFTPQAACGHHGPIRPGSVFCCMVCSQSGQDGHPALKRNPRTDPRPEPKAAAPRKPGARESRKQRRGRLYAARESSPPGKPHSASSTVSSSVS